MTTEGYRSVAGDCDGLALLLATELSASTTSMTRAAAPMSQIPAID